MQEMTGDTTIILGVDPGLRATGFGLIEIRENRPVYMASGTIRTSDGDLASRLGTIFTGLRELAERYRPTVAAIEKVFVNVNPASTLLLGQARGAAITALVSADLPVHEYTALQLKQAVTGHGHATKEQVQLMVQRLLALPGLPASDAADALACAICHLHGGALRAAVAGAGSGLPAGMRLRRGRLS